jgi:hypothetical protein
VPQVRARLLGANLGGVVLAHPSASRLESAPATSADVRTHLSSSTGNTWREATATADRHTIFELLTRGLGYRQEEVLDQSASGHPHMR